MANIQETLKQLPLHKPAPVKFVRKANDLGIKAEAMQRWGSSEEYFWMKVPISRLGLGYGEILAESEVPKALVVVDLNKNKVGKTIGGFKPPVVIMAGADIIANAKQNRATHYNCWVGKKAIKALGLTIQADCLIGSNELGSELRQLLKTKYPKNYCYIVEVYPFEKYFIYQCEGDNYKQAFTLDPVNRKVALTGTPSTVFTQYKTAEEIKAQSVSDTTALEPDGAGYPSPKKIMEKRQLADTQDYGAPTSHLNNPSMNVDMSNVGQALAQYLSDTKNGIWKPVSSAWSPVPYTQMQVAKLKVAAVQAGVKNFSVSDFAKWHDSKKEKTTVKTKK